MSLLIYLAVLHGRYAGWFGNFGLAVGAVVGACSILMAWYGVNFVLGSGLHTYGEGVGGVQWAFWTVGLNVTFAILAAFRYILETGGRGSGAGDREAAAGGQGPGNGDLGDEERGES